MSREKMIQVVQGAIRRAERFCEGAQEDNDRLMELLRRSGHQDLVERGKKAICDGMAVGKAFATDHLASLCEEADSRGMAKD